MKIYAASSGDSPLMGTKEVAVYLGVSERTAARLFAGGDIRAFKLHDKLWRTTRMIVDQYIRDQMDHRRIMPIHEAPAGVIVMP